MMYGTLQISDVPVRNQTVIDYDWGYPIKSHEYPNLSWLPSGYLT
jgi:hypothetical protein